MRTLIILVTLISVLPFNSGRLLHHPDSSFKKPIIQLYYAPRPSASASTLDAADQCVTNQNVQCDQNAVFRSIDGSCNNLAHPLWGRSNSALSRLGPAQFHDGVSEPRKAVSGNSLPSVRDIAVTAYSFVKSVDYINTLALMSVGQILSHDVSLIGAPLIFDEKCCTEGGDNCLNINVSPNDPYYKQFNVSCIPMFRAPTTASIDCSLAPRYTLSSVTHFIDASFVYGSTEDLATSLREKAGGRLRADIINGQSFPPHNYESSNFCYNRPGDLCMKAGDARANQNPPLGALQIIFFREHNRLATELASINPHWDDERLYQEARRILIAQWQTIVYRDYLPLIIGPDTARAEGLVPNFGRMCNEYDEHTNPSTSNDFTSAAFRVFHSLITDGYCDKGGETKANGCPFGATKFSSTFDNPHVLTTKEGFQSVLHALNKQNAAKIDNAYSVEISGQMFHRERPWGLDLVSADINRGRDVGLPSYNTYRSLCGMKQAKKWKDLLGDFEEKDLHVLRSVYEDPEDLDVYVAGTLEKKFGKAIVGPTFECILVDQFKRWRKGDRFFVDFKGFPHSFTPEQSSSLANTSLARLFCDNSEGVEEIAKNIFLLSSERVSCDKIPKIDLMPWQQNLAFLEKEQENKPLGV